MITHMSRTRIGVQLAILFSGVVLLLSCKSDRRPSPTSALCGNGVIDEDEKCDGNCPTSCDDRVACTTEALVGSAATCDAVCTFAAVTECKAGDGCCAPGCDTNNDSDCSASCGNGEQEEKEVCDGDCPDICNDGQACTADALVGAAAQCSASCSYVAITQCASGDGCCAPGCNATNDSDCSPSCGNAVIESGEQCDDGNESDGDGCNRACRWTVTQVAAGGSHTCALLSNGKVRCWGYGFPGQLGYGNGNNIGDDETPASAGDVDVGGTVTQLAAGGSHTCALLSNGKVRCWGDGSFGRLGYGNENQIGDNETPASAGDVDVGGTATQVVAGEYHTCALLSNGKVRCWGFGVDGQLGYGYSSAIGDNETPASAGDVNVGGTVTQLAADGSHTCALLSNGKVRCWGYGLYGRLGYGNTNSIGYNETPASAGDVDVGGSVTQIAAGDDHTCALLSNGAVRCWGYGLRGRLGYGYGNTNNIGDNETPASAGDVNVGGTVTQLATSGDHTCALLSNSAVRCWGYGGYGELGYGNINDIGDDELPTSVGPVIINP